MSKNFEKATGLKHPSKIKYDSHQSKTAGINRWNELCMKWLEKQNKALQKQNDELLLEHTELYHLKQENDELKQENERLKDYANDYRIKYEDIKRKGIY